MAISFTRPDPASPASVSAAQFPTSRRGYDQAEVRDFLRMVAAEQARLQERERFLDRELKAAQLTKATSLEAIDEDTATRLLGEEAARILHTAREAAVQIRARAEEAAARLLRDATDEAQRLREEAEIEAARRRQDAAADSEAELTMAKQQGRDMVNEARAYRERVLSELARRRELARQQIEQLIHGRDRLLQAFERSRVAAVEVMAELSPLGEPNEYVNLQPTTGPVPMMVPSGAQATSADLASLVNQSAESDPQSEPEIEVDSAGDELPSPSPIAAVADLEESSEDTATDESAPQDPPAEFRADLRVVEDFDDAPSDDAPADDASADDAAAVEAESEPDALGASPAETDESEGAEVVALFTGDSDHSDPKPVGATVEDLFARLRAARTDEVARTVDDAPTDGSSALTIVDNVEPSPVAAVDGETPIDAADEPAVPVDEVIVPLIVSAARKLKRVLADEQNDLLDTLRRREPIRSLDVLLPWEADQSARYVAAVEDDLLASASAGAQGGENGRNPAIIRPAVDAVTNEIVAPLRDRLIRCIDKAEGDNVELANLVRSLYREWKTQRIDDHVEDIVRLAYDRGALTIASR
jgi:DivIVA domain-containing protein